MRAIPIVLFFFALSVAAEESKKPTLAETLEREKRGELDDTAKDELEQIDAMCDRFHGYLASCDDAEERKTIRAVFRTFSERILERLRQRLREAEEQLERLEHGEKPVKSEKT